MDVYAGSFCWLFMLAVFAIWVFILAILVELASGNIYAGSPSVYACCAAWLFILSKFAGSAGMLDSFQCFLAGFVFCQACWLANLCGLAEYAGWLRCLCWMPKLPTLPGCLAGWLC
jgi:hypothetical protein